jgi:hypothetical protein
MPPPIAVKEEGMKTLQSIEAERKRVAEQKNNAPTYKPQHTMLPWKHTTRKDGRLTRTIRCATADSIVVGQTYKSEDAAFLVRVVNTHQELLEAAKMARTTLFLMFQHKQREAFVKGQCMDLWTEIKELDKTIAKAEDR